jgi:ATP-dependent protease ClpP protease subunit
MSREFLVYGPIGSDGVTAGALATALQNLGPGPVTIRINSPGGDVFAGLSMLSLVRQHGNVTAIIDGLCASAATFVAFGAKRVVMAKEAMMMLHAPSTSGGGNSEQLREQADFLDRVANQIVSLYATRSGKTTAEVATWLRGETWFTAEEAKASKLIDEIIEAPVQVISCAWRFASAPASIAAKLDPLTTIRAENARLVGELAQARADAAAARVDAELVGVTVTTEARAALVKAFVADATGARALVAQVRAGSSGHHAVVVIASDAAQRNSATGDAYDSYVSRLPKR